jgi:hypothetical protein
MDESQTIVAFVWGALALVFAAAALGHRIGRGRADRRGDVGDEQMQDAERLARVEASVDAIAVELERVAEGQRFVTRLLAESKIRLEDRARSPRSPIPPVWRHESPPPKV